MNPQMYIPIHILLAHEKLQAVGASEDLVTFAAMRSAKLGIDLDKANIRPILKSKRNVIILRDIPDGTTEEQVRGIFVGGPHPDKITSVKPEVNNTWFVKFDLNEGTQDVVLWLKTQEFNGAKVNAAIKSEHFLRSFFPVHPAGVLPHLAQPDPAMGGYPDPAMGGYPLDMMPQMPGFDGVKGFDVGKGFDGGKSFGGKAGDGKGKGKFPGFTGMEGGKGKGKKGKGGGGGAAMVPPSPWMQPSPQPLGYWQPWGARSDAKATVSIPAPAA